MSFQNDIIALVRKVDANWYEGRVGDRKGIVPSSYLEVRTRLSSYLFGFFFFFVFVFVPK